MSLGSVTQKQLDEEFVATLKSIKGLNDTGKRDEGFELLELIVRIYNFKSVKYASGYNVEARAFRESLSKYSFLINKF